MLRRMSHGGSLVERARDLAAAAHEGQVRKAGNIPYFAHLESVVATLRRHGYEDEVTLAAAYLHDLVEDRPAFEAQLRELPQEVIDTVLALTEQKLDADGAKREKRARFESYAAGLRSGSEAAKRAIPISCADKIDNLRSLVEAEQQGLGLLSRLSTKPHEHALQLATLRAIYAPLVCEAMLAELDHIAAQLSKVVGAFLLERAIEIATRAHEGQRDKAGAPYIEHPMRLVERASTDEERMVAALHDVVEDGGVTLEDLVTAGFPRDVVRAVDHLTKRPEEAHDYAAFIERVAKDRLASRVKLLDLEDNSDLSRLSPPTDADRARTAKYARAIERLRAELAKRSLYVVLDEESRAKVRAIAVYPEVRGDHVTLAHRVDPQSLSPEWIPGGANVGDRVELEVRGQAMDGRVQALVVSMGGTRKRPSDGGMLHVTVSFASEARAGDANALLGVATLVPLRMHLSGTVQWIED
jgi:hypothetical protein